LLLGACREESSPPPAPRPSPEVRATATQTAVAAQASAAQPSKPKPNREVAIGELVESWRAAQVSGDFAAYEALYAKELVGIKRVGLQAFRFDRNRWLADRKGMLAHKPQVGVRGLEIRDAGATVVVRFEQTYTSKSFRDVGTKQLVLIEQDGKLKIGREEMLASLVATPPGVVSFPDFAFVVHHGDKPYVLLEQHERKPDAKLELVDFDSVLSAAETEVLPSARRELAGSSLVLFAEAGEVCRAKVQRLVVLSRAIAHFGQRQAWRGDFGQTPVPRPQVARELAELAGNEGSFLAAELEPSAACTPARWARAKDRPAPALLNKRKATVAEAKTALQAFEALPVYSANQKRFEAEQQKGAWTDYGTARPEVSVFEGSAGKWVAVSAEAGTGCNDYRGEGWSLFKESGSKLEPVTFEAHQRSYFVPAMLFDANGDGNPEVLGKDTRLAQPQNGKQRFVLDLTPRDFDCGC
jgi:ketosteroid isomerase-like protein